LSEITDHNKTGLDSRRRNGLLQGAFAAIDTEYTVDESNKIKPYSIFAAAIVNSSGDVKAKHIFDFASFSQPEKALVQWLMTEILKYPLTLGWYSRGVKRINEEDGTVDGKDSDLKIIDEICKYYNVHSIVRFDRRGTPYVGGYPKP
jgi:hypothetical protein